MLTEYSLEILGKMQKIAHDENYHEGIVTWDGTPSIFSKFDYYSAIFENVTVSELFSCLHLDNFISADLEEYFNSIRPTLLSGMPVCAFNCYGVSIQIPYFDFISHMGNRDIDVIKQDNESSFLFLNIRFPSIRLNISGTGMEYLRCKGIDIDSLIVQGFTFDHVNASYHSTRCDFAFDLINYKGDFYDDLIECCKNNSVGYTVPTSSGKGVSWTGNVGANKTVYLGSPGSVRMLRVYDKKFQFERANQWISQCPYRNGDLLPDSWIRIELQTRTSETEKLLVSDLEPKQLLKYIYDKYSIRTLEKVYNCGQPVYGDVTDTWSTLFDFDEIDYLIKDSTPNENFVQLKSASDRATEAVISRLKHVLRFFADHGIQGGFELINSLIYTFASCDKDSPFGRKYLKINDFLCEDTGTLPSGIILDHNNVIQLCNVVSDSTVYVFGHQHNDKFNSGYYLDLSTGQVI